MEYVTVTNQPVIMIRVIVVVSKEKVKWWDIVNQRQIFEMHYLIIEVLLDSAI